MSEVLEIIAKNLVEKPEEVSVTEETKEDGSILLKLSVAKEDMGKVIGKHGKIAKSIRSILKVAAIKNNKKVYVEIG